MCLGVKVGSALEYILLCELVCLLFSGIIWILLTLDKKVFILREVSISILFLIFHTRIDQHYTWLHIRREEWIAG